MEESPPASLHSRYNPTREAERFTDTLRFPRNVTYIIVCEPGESFLADALRGRYPGARLIALRLADGLYSETDSLWDAVWRVSAGISLESFLLNEIPDEYVPLTQYVEWQPAVDYWREAAESVRSAFRRFLDVQKKVMITRTAFGPRWLKNMVDNLSCPFETLEVWPGYSDIFLTGAGPSLDLHAQLAKKAPFVLAVSSSLPALRYRGVFPDLCVATDGGYWARRYFRDLPNGCPIAVPLEAAVPRNVLAGHPVLPLSYGGALESHLYETCGMRAFPAKRNGTVSGTAVELALSLTSGAVFASGLDFQSGPAFHHARPHYSEAEARAVETRCRPASNAFFQKGDGALDVYAEWFESNANRLTDRFSRLNPSGRYLKGIQDADPIDAVRSFESGTIPPRFRSPERFGNGDRREALRSTLVELSRKFGERASESAHCPDAVSSEMREFMQLADYRAYMNFLNLPGSSDPEGAGGSRLSSIYESMSRTADDLALRLERHAFH